MKISVVLTTYNGALYIIEQLDSLRMQTRMPDEVIIYDDKSSDQTVELIENYIKNWNLEGWRIVVNKENMGWKKNFHLAISDTIGDIVFFCDQDDIWLSTKIEKMLTCFSNNQEIEVLSCKLNLIDKDGRLLPDNPSALPFNSNKTKQVKINLPNDKFIYTVYPGCTMAVKRTMINTITQCVGYEKIAHDALYWKIGTLAKKSYILDEALIKYRIHTSNASNPASAGSNKIKTIERRIHEIENVEMLLGNIESVIKQNFNIIKSDQELISSLKEFLYERKRFLRRENNRLWFFLKYGKYYRNTKMFFGDLLCCYSEKK